MIYNEIHLPFEVERPCRCSFVVRLSNDEHAFITNSNLFYMMQHPTADFHTIVKRDTRGLDQKWIVVAKVIWDLGFKPKKFDCNGRAI